MSESKASESASFSGETEVVSSETKPSTEEPQQTAVGKPDSSVADTAVAVNNLTEECAKEKIEVTTEPSKENVKEETKEVKSDGEPKEQSSSADLKVEETVTKMEVDEVKEEASEDKPSQEGGNEEAAPAAPVERKRSITSLLAAPSGNNCYCAKPRNYNIIELLCAGCLKWFHESCISYQFGKLLPFMLNYYFQCKNCSPSGLETFKKTHANFNQMCITAIANLMVINEKEGKPIDIFSRDRDIIPFIENYWESLTTSSRRVSTAWHNTIAKAVAKDGGNIFIVEETTGEQLELLGPLLIGLKNPDLSVIRPSYEVKESKGRGAKRRAVDQSAPWLKKARQDQNQSKLSAHGYPLEHPFNKEGYRYILAEPDPHAPFRQEFDESTDCAGKPIPPWLYRVLTPQTVLLSLNDRAQQLKIGDTRLTVTGDKGYCMVRANQGVSWGTWFWEAEITEQPDTSACRLGWGQQFANLQAPLGYDKFGYSWRSRKGTKFHESHGLSYSSGYGVGDTLGFLIHLPGSELTTSKHIPPSYKDKPLVKVKNHLYYEQRDYPQKAVKKLRPKLGSEIEFFKNGESQGVAWSDIYKGTYYPTISCFRNITIKVNFGPTFKHPPKMQGVRAMCERADDAHIEQSMSDMLFLLQNEGKMKLDTS